MMTPRYNPLALAIAMAATATSPVFADNLILEEVVVTAQKRAQGLQDVPISITAVSGEKLDDFNITALEELSNSVPNLTITKGGISNQIGMRGIYSSANKGFEQSVAMYVDEVYYGRGQLIRLPLVDLERVEVLRGPQPTLFGKNAIAGAISLNSAKPSDEYEVSISTLYEFEHEESKTVAIVSGPITDNLAARVVVSYRDVDGWIDNTNLNRKEPETQESYIRGTLQWDNGEDLTATLKVEKADFDTKGRSMENHSPVGNYSAVFAGPFSVETDLDYNREDGGSASDNEVDTVVFTLEYDINEYSLTSTTAYLAYETAELIDVDYTALDLFDGTNQSEDYKQYSQEFRIASPAVGNVDYIAGLYYQRTELDATDDVFFGSAFGVSPTFSPVVGGSWDREFEQDSEVWSIFAQVNWRITDQLALTLGGRYSDEEKQARRILVLRGENTSGIPADALFPGSPAFGPQAGFTAALGQLQVFAHDTADPANGLSDTRNEKQFDGLVNLQYEFSDNAMFYASITQGSKAGGFDIRSNNIPGAAVSPGSFEFEDEQATSYEIGGKFSFDRGEVNVAAFLTDYEDLQVTQFDGTVGFNVQNAAEAEISGLELDARYLITENLLLSASFAYLDFEFKDFDVSSCPAAIIDPNPTPSRSVPGLCNIEGARAANTPEFSGNVSLQYEHNVANWGIASYSLNMDYSDHYRAGGSIDPNVEQGSYTKFGLRLALSSIEETWQVAIIGKNLTDERILTNATGLPLSTTLTGGAGIAYYGIYQRPRSYALELSYQF